MVVKLPFDDHFLELQQPIKDADFVIDSAPMNRHGFEKYARPRGSNQRQPRSPIKVRRETQAKVTVAVKTIRILVLPSARASFIWSDVLYYFRVNDYPSCHW